MAISVYLDQNVYGHFYDTEPNWKSDPLAEALLELSQEGKIEVWISPTHVMELCQASNHERRSNIAAMMLELADAKRMWAGPDYFLVRNFGQFINNVVPGAFDPKPFFEKYQDNAMRIWLGYLGLLAAVPDIELGQGKNDILRMKGESQLIHARIAADPDRQLQKLIDAATNMSTSPNPDPLGLSQLTDEQIQEELADLKTDTVGVDKRTLQKIARHRWEISAVYGAIEIGGVMDAIFQYPCDIELTFNAPLLVSEWSKFQAKFGCPSLPKAFFDRDADELKDDRHAVIEILNSTIVAAARAGMASLSVGYYILLRELEVTLNHGALPTQGIGFDMDHAAAAMEYQIFVSHDNLLRNNVKTFISGIGQSDSRCVVENARQLRKAVADVADLE